SLQPRVLLAAHHQARCQQDEEHGGECGTGQRCRSPRPTSHLMTDVSSQLGDDRPGQGVAEREGVEERLGRQPPAALYHLGSHQRDHRRSSTETEQRHAGERDEEFEVDDHHTLLNASPTPAPATMRKAGCTSVKAAITNAAATKAARNSVPRRLLDARALGANEMATPNNRAITTGLIPARASWTTAVSLVAAYRPPSATMASPEGAISPVSALSAPANPATRQPK